MPTAQETYAEMIKARMAPGLRALGLKGSGQSYELPSIGYWAMVGFQKSAYSSAETVRFTSNVLVVSRAAWDAAREELPHLGARPTANTYAGSFVWQHRIGRLLPDNRDLWWKVEAGADTTKLAASVLATLEKFALPAMRQQLRDQ